MLKVLFTSDYEIHGNGEGLPDALLIEPTDRMIDSFDRYGAKLTIMADVSEIMKFREYLETSGKDDYSYHGVIDQLKRAVGGGHDVQLHIHSAYYNAVHRDGKWMLDWSEYDLTGLEKERINEIVKTGKSFLEEHLKAVRPDYSCMAFRSANWSMSPSENIVDALIDNSITIDTSVFKYGKRKGIVTFDYSHAESDLVPWPLDKSDVCRRSDSSPIFEFPIYTEKRSIWKFLTFNRLYRVYHSRMHPVRMPRLDSDKPVKTKKASPLSKLTSKHPWKMDFNQCSGKQLIEGLRSAEKKYAHLKVDLPFVLIGHSKLFTAQNERSLRPFLQYVKNHPDRYSFAVFGDFDLDDYRR